MHGVEIIDMKAWQTSKQWIFKTFFSFYLFWQFSKWAIFFSKFKVYVASKYSDILVFRVISEF